MLFLLLIAMRGHRLSLSRGKGTRSEQCHAQEVLFGEKTPYSPAGCLFK